MPANTPGNYDFSGLVTVYGVLCADGRVIENGAFDHQDGQTVPLVWRHGHDNINNVLGHVLLARNLDPSGMRGYSTFNNTPEAKRAKHLVHNKDITQYSIYANGLNELRDGEQRRVKKGIIREASLVLAGKNPGARIDDVVKHSDDPLDPDEIIVDGIIIHNDDRFMLELSVEVTEEEIIEHTDETKDESTEEIEHEGKTLKDVMGTLDDDQRVLFNVIVQSAITGEKAPQENSKANGTGKTVKEIYDSLSEEQRTVLHYVAGELSQQKSEESVSQGDTDMPQNYNIFEMGKENTPENALSHEKVRNILEIARKSRPSSLRELFVEHEAVISHSITNISYLFPDAQRVDSGGPQFYSRPMEWVEKVLGACNPRPFSRIKSRYADLTADAARAKGYVTGAQKVEEVIVALTRTTTPQTIYKLQKLDRDDIIDIVDFDVVVWLKTEMRMMLREELARAILISDGRSAGADKIVETNVRPIYNDDPTYTVDAIYNDIGNEKALSAFTDAELIDLIDYIAEQRQYYRGSGSPVFYTQPEVLTKLLLVRDTTGRRIYETEAALAAALRVSDIVEVPPMSGMGRTGEVDPPSLPTGTYNIDTLGVIVNLNDYVIGMDRGGQTSFFDDFDLDYNKYTYLYETRLSGAMVQPKAAISVELVIAKTA